MELKEIYKLPIVREDLSNYVTLKLATGLAGCKEEREREEEEEETTDNEGEIHVFGGRDVNVFQYHKNPDGSQYI